MFYFVVNFVVQIHLTNNNVTLYGLNVTLYGLNVILCGLNVTLWFKLTLCGLNVTLYGLNANKREVCPDVYCSLRQLEALSQISSHI